MKEEFNLSEKIKTNEDWKPYSEFSFYWATDVKEFIRRLKEGLKKIKMKPLRTEELMKNKVIIADYVYWKDFREEIDRLFEGEEAKA